MSDNTGAFVAHIEKSPAVQPMAYEDFVPIDVTPGAPVRGCSVVVFYIDGLRPDVVKEMAAMGHLPNINRLFIEGGVWMSNAFTGFPSDTITSNGTMWTGCFSDRHGLKGQVSFSRRTLESKSYLDLMGPSRSARQLAPQGLDRLLTEAGKAGVQTIEGEEASRRWIARKTTGVPPIYEHLRHNGTDWATGAVPVMSDFPPVPFSRSLTKYVPLCSTTNRGDTSTTPMPTTRGTSCSSANRPSRSSGCPRPIRSATTITAADSSARPAAPSPAPTC